MIDLILRAGTWVAIAFLIFCRRPGQAWRTEPAVSRRLDDRSARIKAELDEALSFRKEAEGVLAEYRRRQGEAREAAESIILMPVSKPTAWRRRPR